MAASFLESVSIDLMCMRKELAVLECTLNLPRRATMRPLRHVEVGIVPAASRHRLAFLVMLRKAVSNTALSNQVAKPLV